MSLTITTSNVNGLRAAHRKGVLDWLDQSLPNVWCMQEVRAPQDAVDTIVGEIGERYKTVHRSITSINEICNIKGRAGVALITDLPVLATRYGVDGLSDDVDTGRWIEADIQTPQGYTVTVACVYVHAGNADDEIKMTQKYRFLDAMLQRLQVLQDASSQGGNQAVLCGDFNIAHTPQDIKNAKANETHAGFLPQERAYVDQWLTKYEFVDVVRDLAGDIEGPYTWWSQRGKAFDNNVGWRIDYQFATPELADSARRFYVDKAANYDARWSDHAPLSVTYDV